MKGPFKRIVFLATLLSAATTRADPRYAVDRFEPSERGSDWLANESLDLRGTTRPAIGYVTSFARRVVVDGSAVPVKDLAFVRLGGSMVFVDRLRVAIDMPFQVYTSGESGSRLPPPSAEAGIGDLRLGADVRLLGAYRQGVTGAIGAQVWLPTGQQSQWAGDGTLRARPRAMLSGEIGALVWAAQVGLFLREDTEITASAAAGVRLRGGVVIGPEVIASSTLARSATPVEAMLGAHWLVAGSARFGGGVGAGLTDAPGAPAWRAMLTLEWAPQIRRAPRPRLEEEEARRRDSDHDGVPDHVDACPHVPGVATTDPRTNGCPPDSDGDGIDDLTDACPTLPGIVTQDPTTNGCPDQDRDRDGIANEVDACPDDSGPPDVDPRRNGCPRAVLREGRIHLFDPIAFAGDTAELVASDENEAILTAVLKVALALPAPSTLRIEGHTDDRGDPATLKKLGFARAAAVAKWLVQHGIDRARITTEGIGPSKPVATNETDAGRAENRRIELLVLP